MRNGQPVELTIDSFHGTRLRGHVDSLSPASGLEFALLPPDNATGNFTKIVQRVPVKIVLDDRSLTGLLRPGMSAEPTIDTKATVLAERETKNRWRRRWRVRTAAEPHPFSRRHQKPPDLFLDDEIFRLTNTASARRTT